MGEEEMVKDEHEEEEEEEGEGMDPYRRTAIIVAVLFIIGTVAYSVSVAVFMPILDDPDYLVEVSENDSMVGLGALFVLISGAAVVSIPFMMFPLFKRRNEELALGYVVFRVLEVACYIAMVIAVLMLISLSHDFVDAGAPDDPSYQSSGAVLLGAYDWTTLVIAVVFSLGALIFYYLLYMTKLVPGWLSLWGLIGAILHLAGGALGILGSLTEEDMPYMLMALPIGVNEMVLAIWLIVKGFNPQEIESGSG